MNTSDKLAMTYPIGRMPVSTVKRLAKLITYHLAFQDTDFDENAWAFAFANAIGLRPMKSKLGVASVINTDTAWCMRVVICDSQFDVKRVLIPGGRCSPDYSYGIEDAHENIQETGEAVLAIWNSRVDITLGQYPQARVCVLVRSNDMSQFALFEEYLTHYNTADFTWQESKTGTFEGIDKRSGEKRFVWQPHGSQFTIVTAVPDSAIKFKLRKPPLIQQDTALKGIGFDDTWVEIM